MKSRISLIKAPVLLLFVLFIGACSNNSNDQPTTDTNTNTSDFDDGSTTDTLLQGQLQEVVNNAVESGFPGVSLYVQRGEQRFEVVAGVANVSTSELVTPTSIFQVASVGKIYVATMFLRFAEMGMLQLDDPIDRWLEPDMSAMIADSDQITVEMLLAHTTGIQDYLNESVEYLVDFAESPGKIWTAVEILGYVNSEENYFEPGEQHQYSNTNFVLLGVIAEKVTGMSLGMAMRQMVLQPAGLESTFGAFEELGQSEVARGYIPTSAVEGLSDNLDIPTDGSDIDTFEWLKSVGLGDTPIHSTPSDLNLFIRTLIDSELLVAGEMKTKMLTETFTNSSGYGLGIVIADNAMTFGHEGRLFGLHSALYYTPSTNTSYATVVNAAYDEYDSLFAEYIEKLTSVLESQER